jgi:ferritin
MIDIKMAEALNRQVNEELYSAYLYLSMSAYFETLGLSGFAKWMRIQSKEELGHAMKIYDYLIKQNAEVKLLQIKEPPHSWDSLTHAIEAAYEHEKYITGKINELVTLSENLNDRATNSFLQWFIDEQVEEEKNAYELLKKVKMAEKHVGALLTLDEQVGKREEEEEEEEED